MEWSKVKNIMILMLVVTNLALLLLVFFPRAQEQRHEDEGRRSALALMERRGISVDERIIPHEINFAPQRITPDRTSESTLASNLLGDNVICQDLGGNVLQYSNGSGIIRFHSGGEFTVQLEPGSHPMEDVASEDYSDQVVSLLQLDAQLTSIVREDSGFSLVYEQRWGGIPLLDYGLTLQYENNCLVQISSAKQLTGTPVEEISTPLPVSTALMQFMSGLNQLGDICRTITTITPAYSATTDLSGIVQLSPLWLIDTDTGAYQLDLSSGVLTRI